MGKIRFPKQRRRRILSAVLTFSLLFAASVSHAPAGHAASVNVAAGKTVTASDAIYGNASAVTDGNKDTDSFAGVTQDLQWLQVDLGQSYSINKINVWHYFGDGRTYHDVIVRVSNDASFGSGVTTVFNNDSNNSAGFGAGPDAEYAENSAGKSISFGAVNARYVRLYTNGSSANVYNHYVEVEVFSADSQNSAPGAASLSADSVNNTGSYTVTVTVPAGNTATSMVLYENGTAVLTRSVAAPQTFTYPVSGKAVGSYLYRADLTNAYGTTPSVNLTVTVTAPSSGGTNVAAGKSVTASDAINGNASAVTDGNKSVDNYIGVTQDLQWLQVDLGQSYSINKINVWHYFGDGRTYHDVIVRVSNDASFGSGVTTVFNNDSNNSAGFGAGSDAEYAESSAGKSISFGAVNARYVRLYTNGSSSNIYNHYVEVEVFSAGSQNSAPGAASLSADSANNTGSYTVTVTVPAGNTASSMALYENGTAVLTRSVTAPQTFTYPVSGKADGSYLYRADLTNAYGTTPSANLTVTVSKNPPSANVMFDDFSYTGSADPNISLHGWTLRSETAGPGPSGCVFDPANISFLTDPQNSANKLMRLTASTDGTGSGTRQAEVYTANRKYNKGTYAARVKFTDAPVTGSDGAEINETFFTISPLDGYRDPTYSECDFEYLANGGWGSGQGIWTTSWHTYTEDPWYKDGSSRFGSGSYAGWHNLVITVADDGTTTYYIDGTQFTQDSPYYGPRKDMTINFNLWFITGSGENPLVASSYTEDVDWVFHAQDTVLTPAQVEARVQSYRSQSTTFTDTVN